MKHSVKRRSGLCLSLPLLVLLITSCTPTLASHKGIQAGMDGQLISMVPISDPAQNASVQLYKMFYWSAGSKVEALLAKPTAPGKYPLVVNCHGGYVASVTNVKHVNFGVTIQDLENNTTANEIVLAPEYRGYEGSAGSPQGLDGIVLDVNNAITSIERLPDVRPNDIYVEGVSMGGGAALMLASERKDVRAVVGVSPFVGYDEYVKWIGKLKLTGPGYRSAVQLIQDDYGRNPSGTSYTSRSPIDHLNSIQCPVLILQGKADPNNLWPEVQDYYRRALVRHKNVKLIYFKNGNHGLSNYEGAVSTDIADWFSKYGLS